MTDSQDTLAAQQEKYSVFVSHSTDDKRLAAVFTELITDISGGLIKVYSSSSFQADSGIPYGNEWFHWICERIDQAKFTIALLTPNSLAKPWILFEAGLTKASDSRKLVGLAIGVTSNEAYTGPFYGFQNCSQDADSLVKLCLQLVHSTPLNPRESVIRTLVDNYIVTVNELQISPNPIESEKVADETAMINILEDIRLMVQAIKGSPAIHPTTQAHDVESIWRLAGTMAKVMAEHSLYHQLIYTRNVYLQVGLINGASLIELALRYLPTQPSGKLLEKEPLSEVVAKLRIHCQRNISFGSREEAAALIGALENALNQIELTYLVDEEEFF